MSFDRESSVTYTFQEPFSVMQNRSSQASTSSTDSRAREDVALSFVTSQRPAMLLTVSTFSQQYIAVILATNGTYRNHTWKCCCSCASVFFVNANFKNTNMLLVGKEAALNNIYILVSEELQQFFHSMGGNICFNSVFMNQSSLWPRSPLTWIPV